MFLLLLGTNSNIFAGGFQINEHGARAMALGGAFTAIANDASAVYWNPAGISFLKGTQFILGTAMIAPQSSFRGVTPAVDAYYMHQDLFFPSHFFVTHQFNSFITAGVGISSPFGLETTWDNDWIGRYLAINTKLTTFSAPLVVSFALLDNLSISVGGSYSWASVTIRQATPLTPFQGDAMITLDGTDNTGFGYNFGFMWRPIDEVSIGGSFKSEVNYDFTGTATSQGPGQVAGQLPKGDISAKLTTPINIQGGIAVRVIKQLRLSADFQWVQWSSYDTLAVDFKNPAFEDIASPRLYDDSYILRFGAEFDWNDDISLLGGFYFDKNPVDPKYVNPSLPDTDRLGFSVGVDAQLWENFGITGSFLFIRGKQLTVTNSQEIYTSGNSPFNGTYNASASLLSLSLHYTIN